MQIKASTANTKLEKTKEAEPSRLSPGTAEVEEEDEDEEGEDEAVEPEEDDEEGARG